MGITSIKELNAGRVGDVNDKMVVEYDRTLRIRTDSPFDGQMTVILGCGVRRYDSYQDANGNTDPRALAVSIKVAPEDEVEPYGWIATVHYTTAVWDELARRGVKPPSSGQGDGGQNSTSPIDNPLLMPPEVSYDFQDSSRVLTTDLKGDHVLNSAGERFNPGKEIVDALIVITIQANAITYDAATLTKYYNAVNNQPFLGNFIGTVLCKGIKGSQNFFNNVQYYKTTGVFHVRTQSLLIPADPPRGEVILLGWAIDEAPLDHGENERKVGALKRTPILRAGVRAGDVLLNGGGLDAGEDGKPIYLLGGVGDQPRFQFYKRANFYDLYPSLR